MMNIHFHFLHVPVVSSRRAPRLRRYRVSSRAKTFKFFVKKSRAPHTESNGREIMYSQPDTGGLSKDEIRQAFREFDLERNGYVGAAEIAHVLASMGEKVTDDEIDEMILMADTDGDGQISFDEFHRLMHQLSGTPLAQNRGGPGMQVPPHMQGRGQAPYGQPPNMALNRGGYQQGQQNFGGGGYGGPPHMGGDYGGQQSMGGGYGVGVGSGGAGAAGDGGGSSLSDLQSFQRAQGLDTEGLKKMYQTFLASDKDGSGRVDVNEFVRMLRVDRTPFVERLFSIFDSDRTGLIDVKEFIVGMSNFGGEARDNKIKFAFSVYDLDGSGFIDSSEMQKIIRATNMSTDKQVERKVEWLMRQCDTDGDGNISFDEFTQLSKKFPNIVFPAFNLAGSMAGL